MPLPTQPICPHRAKAALRRGRIVESADQWRLSLGAGRATSATLRTQAREPNSARFPKAPAQTQPPSAKGRRGAGWRAAISPRRLRADRGGRVVQIRPPRQRRDRQLTQHHTWALHRGAGCMAVALGASEESSAGVATLRPPALPDDPLRERNAVALRRKDAYARGLERAIYRGHSSIRRHPARGVRTKHAERVNAAPPPSPTHPFRTSRGGLREAPRASALARRSGSAIRALPLSPRQVVRAAGRRWPASSALASHGRPR